jgi:hypothetical protein
VCIRQCHGSKDVCSKLCLAYYRLMPLVGAVGHVSQTVTVDQYAPSCSKSSSILMICVSTHVSIFMFTFVCGKTCAQQA